MSKSKRLNMAPKIKICPVLLFPLMVLFITNIEAQVLDSLNCTGALGDVKFSILEPDEFINVNGACWILMDGRNIDPDSELADKGFLSIPDARGVFIRAYDNRQQERVDKDREFGDPVGSYQEDLFKEHRHIFHHGKFGDDKTSVPTNAADNYDGTPLRQKFTSKQGGYETRPKNITLWTYLRIY